MGSSNDFDKELWNQISEHYDNAKKCLWCPSRKNLSGWRRDDKSGMYHLWNAYYLASKSDKKDNLLYARILMMMSAQAHCLTSDYTNFHSYVEPAMSYYEAAKQNSENKPTEKELESIRLSYERLKYELSKTDDSVEQYEEALSLIEGLKEVSDFGFHDSEPVYFEHNKSEAKLKLNYCGLILTFKFEDVDDIEIKIDPVCSWINDFYCYRMYHNKEQICFDIGLYKVLCRKISVINVERIKND